MNPGGLRADLVGQGTSAFPRVVTYKDAANVQPFANTLVNEDLTGARIKAALEQQWQPAGSSRPFLKLGISKGFTYTYDPNRGPGLADHRHVPRRHGDRPGRDLLGHGELVPGDRW